jgi:hypothetical protein
MMNERDFLEFNYNVLGVNSRVVGDLVLTGDTILTSSLEGSIEIQGKGKLVLERGSREKGKIKAFDVEIFGFDPLECVRRRIDQMLPACDLSGSSSGDGGFL